MCSFGRSTVAALILNKHLHINGISKKNVKVTDKVKQQASNVTHSAKVTSSCFDPSIELPSEKISDNNIPTTSQKNKFLDPSLKHTLIFRQKFDSFPKPKSSIKSTQSNASQSFVASKKLKYSLSKSVPNLTLCRSPNIYSKNRIFKAIVSLTKEKQINDENFDKIIFTTVDDDQQNTVKTLYNLKLDNSEDTDVKINSPGNEMRHIDNDERECQEMKKSRNVSPNFDRLQCFQTNENKTIDANETNNSTSNSLKVENDNALPESPALTVPVISSNTTHTNPQFNITSKAKSRIVKLTKCSKSPMIFSVGKNNVPVEQIKFNKRRFLGVGKGKPSKGDVTPERIPKDRQGSEDTERDDRKKQASLHKMKRERKVSNNCSNTII